MTLHVHRPLTGDSKPPHERSFDRRKLERDILRCDDVVLDPDSHGGSDWNRIQEALERLQFIIIGRSDHADLMGRSSAS